MVKRPSRNFRKVRDKTLVRYNKLRQDYEKGMSLRELAVKNNYTVGTVKIILSQIGRKKRRTSRVMVMLPLSILKVYEKRAAAGSMSKEKFIGDILSLIVTDDLFTAILDED